MKKRRSLHLCDLELTLGEISSTSKPKIDTFEVEDQSLEDTMKENPNQNPKFSIDQVVKRMKLR